MHPSAKPAAACIVLVAGLALTACGDDGDSKSAASTTSTTVPTTASTTATTGAAAQSAKVSANTASQADLVKAMEGVGVSNADRWAKEVEEYRPYPASDPSLAELRSKLAKYNPGPGVVDKIVSALEP